MLKNSNELTYRLTLLFVAVAGVVFLLLLDRAYRDDVMQEHERKLDEAATTMQRHLTVSLNYLTLVTADLGAFLLTRQDPPDSKSFSNVASTLRNHYPALDALVYVGPDRVVREIYPLKGNEKAVGLDLSKRPAAPYIEKAIRERMLIVDPPHTMSNGRLAVIARLPMFRGDRFVGLAQAILHVPDVIQSELGDLGKKFAIQLMDEEGNVFWGAAHLEGVAQRRDVMVGNGHWTLLVAPANAPGVNGLVIALIWGAGGLVLFSILITVRNNYNLSLALKAGIAETTRELRRRNEQLEKEIIRRLDAEASVRRNEQRLCEAQEIARLGNWEWDIFTHRLHWSDEIYRIFGLAPQVFEPDFEHFLSRVHPEDRNGVRQGITTAVEEGRYESEFRITLPEGEIRYLRSIGIIERDHENIPQRMIGTAQDITVQKLTLKALEASERKYRAVLENASDGIVITSLEGKILDGNRRIQSLLGYSRDELLKRHVTEIHPPEDAGKLRIAFSSMREHGFSLFEHLLLRKDGTTTPVEVAGTLVTFGEQQVALGIFRDIRERKRIEAELYQHRYHLEQLVAHRTAELVALNGELESFSYSVSHDLRAPLRAIKGFSKALWEDYGEQLDSNGHDYLKRIQTATERMGHLIDGLLTLSRTIRADMHMKKVSLSAVTSELLKEISAADPERKIRFVVAKGISARCDPTLIRSLLHNLLSNACKFTRTRDDAVIGFGAIDHAGKPVYFVRDNGVGFEMTHASELFKPFCRLHGSEDFEGSGIGLATVQRIVHRHGGRIWAESDAEQGTTFYFTLCEENDEERVMDADQKSVG